MWTQAEAIELCRRIEDLCPAFGCHVALTGGLLYKTGKRKDLDLVFYRIRQVAEIDVDGLFGALARLGIEHSGKCLERTFVIKAAQRGRVIDCFFPEVPSGEYPTEHTDDSGPGIDALFAETP